MSFKWDLRIFCDGRNLGMIFDWNVILNWVDTDYLRYAMIYSRYYIYVQLPTVGRVKGIRSARRFNPEVFTSNTSLFSVCRVIYNSGLIEFFENVFTSDCLWI